MQTQSRRGPSLAKLALLLLPLFSTDVLQAEPCQIPIRARGHARPGVFIFTADSVQTNTGGLFAVDENGKCVFQKAGGLPVDFRPHKFDGQSYFSYLNYELGVVDLSIFGPRQILDRSLKPLKTIQSSIETVAGPMNLDMHEFEMFGSDHYAEEHYLPEFDWLGRCIIQDELTELNQGERVFSWSTEKEIVPPGFKQSGTFNIRGLLCSDPYHLNSFQKINSPDGYLISLCGKNSVRFIPKYSPAREWKLGGAEDQFQIPSEAQFHGQHSLVWDEKRHKLLLLDNGINMLSLPFDMYAMRVLEFDLDTANHKINSWRSVLSFDSGSEKMGNVSRCGEHCYDIAPSDDALEPALIEYDETSHKRTFELWIGNQPKDYWYYRIYRVSHDDFDALKKTGASLGRD